jgi:threonine synthase
MTSLICDRCERTLDELSRAVRCPACGGLLSVQHDPPGQSGAELRRLFEQRRAAVPPSRPALPSGVWRFRELVLPTASVPVSYPEGNTPVVSRAALSRYAGVEDLGFKHEGMNPTGSFKDRGMTVGVTQAVRVGVRGVLCASTGNTSASLAAYAAQAGIPAYVLVPAGNVAMGKLAQTVGFGATVLAIRGDFDACMRLVQEASRALDLYLLNSVNPFRIEGQKTIVFELLADRGWDPPDWIVLPGGNLGNTAAFGKALGEAMRLGLIARIPRLAVIQAEGAAPFAQSFREDFRSRHTVRAETVASAIRIGDPASWDRGVRAIRDTRGVVISVPDAEILAAQQAINRAGVGCEPASAASLAGVRKLVADGAVRRDARVVAVLTGHMLKDPERLLGDARVGEIEPTLDALAAAIG